MPGSVISSHPITTLLKPEALFLMNSIWMSREVRRQVDGALSAFYLHNVITMASEWCVSIFSPSVCPGAPLFMLDHSRQLD